MKRMLVNANDPEECRIAIVQDGTLQELHVELADRESYLGNIYKGKVVNIEPSIGAAFVNFGGNRNGFLHASDVVPSYADPDVDLMDILEGRARVASDDGPEPVRSVLDEADGEEAESGDTAGDPAQAPVAESSDDAAPEAVAEAEDGTAEAEDGTAEAEDGDASDETASDDHEFDETEFDEAEADDTDTDSDESDGEDEADTDGEGRDDDEDAGDADPGDDDGDDADDAPRPSASSAAAPEDPAPEREAETDGEGVAVEPHPSGARRRRRRRRRRKPGEDDEPNVVDVASSDDDGARAPADVEPDAETAEEDEPEVEDLGKSRTRRRRRNERAKPERRPRTRIPITDLLKKGQEVVVQITKEGIGAKGPTLTTYLSLPGRSLVLMPSLPKCGVSRKIDDDRERRRLKRIVRDLDGTGSGGIGFIVRTAGIGKTAQDLERDLEYLTKLWEVVVQRARVTRPPAPLYVESDLVLRTMRDLFSPDIDEVVIDNAVVYERVRDFVEKLMPRFVSRIRHHDVHAPLFHAYGLEAAVEELYQPQVDLRHGSSIVIEQTEALVAIDVNSGKYKPGSNLEETAYRTNLEAIPEIVRQLKLRDLGGVIIVDFIDMTEIGHRKKVESRFKAALRGDRARINVGRISEYGMLELTRQRVGPGLKRTVFQTCPTCKGTSLVRTVQSMALSVLRAIRALAQLPNYNRLEVYAHPEVCEFLENHKRRDFVMLEDHYERRIVTKAEASYPVDVVHYRFLGEDGKEAKVNIPAGLGVHA